MTKSILAAGTVALAVAMTRLAPAARATVTTAVPAPDPASTGLSPVDEGEALAWAPRASRAGDTAAAPRDDGSDSGDDGDGGDGDDPGDDDDTSES